MSYFSYNTLMSSTYWRVHSVYRRTINLSVGKKFLALQTKDSPLSPISIITNLSASEVEKLNIQKKDLVIVSESKIQIVGVLKNTCFFLKTSTLHDLKLSALPSEELYVPLLYNIKKALSFASTGGFEIIFNQKSIWNDSLILTCAKKHIYHSMNLYNNGMLESSAIELCRLLGLGIGLTPSGDDFLCGVLAGLRLTKNDNTQFAKKLNQEISTHLDDTLDISAAFLFCALKNNFSFAINSLTNHPIIKNNPNKTFNSTTPNSIFKSFSEIGHSSGFDTLCGILYSLMLVTKRNILDE